MTPKKNIIRKPVHTALDGSPIPKMGNFNEKENAFIYWFTNPGTEAFMNSGRAAVRAGYKPTNAVIYGYQLRKKPEIAQAIDAIMGYTKEEMKSMIYHIAFLSRDRMFFKISDFYRSCKRTVKIRGGGEIEVNSVEIIPLDEISGRNQMCINNIEFKGPQNIPMYKLPDRDKAADTFFKCAEIILGKPKTEIMRDAIYGNCRNVTPIEMDWKKTAEFLRGDIGSPVIATPETVKPRKTR